MSSENVWSIEMSQRLLDTDTGSAFWSNFLLKIQLQDGTDQKMLSTEQLYQSILSSRMLSLSVILLLFSVPLKANGAFTFAYNSRREHPVPFSSGSLSNVREIFTLYPGRKTLTKNITNNTNKNSYSHCLFTAYSPKRHAKLGPKVGRRCSSD